jgi:GT2 family glycosyltransferase
MIRVTAIVVARNEEKHIAECLRSLATQTLPRSEYEIILVDGMSTDSTIDQAKVAIVENGVSNFKVIQNPGLTLARGWNMGIRSAHGSFIVRIDAHAYVEKTFLEAEIRLLESHPEVACAGGCIRTIGDRTPMSRCIAGVLSHPFGVGNSMFRIASHYDGYSDTVPYGMYRGIVFREVGFFDEALTRGEDIDMHLRMRSAGLRFWLCTDIVSNYHARNSVRSMIIKSYGDGYWATIASAKNRGWISYRHWVPTLFVLYCLITFLSTLAYGPWLPAFAPAFAYCVLSLLSTFTLFSRRPDASYLAAPLVFLLLHISRGVGALVSASKIFLKTAALRGISARNQEGNR